MISTPRERIDSIDLVRGIVMVIMALDHSHDYFGSLTATPTNLAATTVALFLTRWVTHICAPTFFFLTGTSAFLTLKRMSKQALARFLVTRGLWLIVLEITVMRFALQFNVDYHVTFLVVLWALGWAMIFLAALIWLPLWAIAAFAILLIAGHNVLDGIDARQFGAWAPLWRILHEPGIVLNGARSTVAVAYPLIPWIGVTALGYVFGTAYRSDATLRRRLLAWSGIALVIGFAVLRYTNIYGDAVHWRVHDTAIFTVLSFVDTTKYPPSLLFLMMTLGPMLLLLRAFDAGVPFVLKPVHTIGRVPLFFFVLHFYWIHLLAVGACWWRYGTIANMFESADLAHFPFTAPAGWDFGLPVVYAVWIFVVVTLYPLCHWYAAVRRHHNGWWLSYL